METKVIKEEYAFYHQATYEDMSFGVSWSMLRAADVGTVWTAKEQDRYPNGTVYWKETYTVIYKDDKGCLIRYNVPRHEGVTDSYTELIWYEWLS